MLKTREILEQKALRLSDRVKQELEEAKTIDDTIEYLVKNKPAIDRDRDAVVKLKQFKAVKRPIGDSDKCALICLHCNFSCLKQCTLAEGLEIRWSAIMRRTREHPKEQVRAETKGRCPIFLVYIIDRGLVANSPKRLKKLSIGSRSMKCYSYLKTLLLQ